MRLDIFRDLHTTGLDHLLGNHSFSGDHQGLRQQTCRHRLADTRIDAGDK